MALDTDSDLILANGYRPSDPDVMAAAARWVVAHGGSDVLAALGLEVPR